MNFFGHLKTITKHRHAVMRNCFKCGIYKRGLLHDLSKYNPVEFIRGVRLYQGGTRSPNEKERELYGYSAAWLHHKGRNRHHWEYWNDYNPKTARIEPCRMPEVFLTEMFCDRIAASKIYKGKNYTDSAPLDYYLMRRDGIGMHEETAAKIEFLLRMLAEKGEAETFAYVRKNRKKLYDID